MARVGLLRVGLARVGLRRVGLARVGLLRGRAGAGWAATVGLLRGRAGAGWAATGSCVTLSVTHCVTRCVAPHPQQRPMVRLYELVKLRDVSETERVAQRHLQQAHVRHPRAPIRRLLGSFTQVRA